MTELKPCPYCKENKGTHHKGYCSEYCRDMADITNRLKKVVEEIEESDRKYEISGRYAIEILYRYIPELKED